MPSANFRRKNSVHLRSDLPRQVIRWKRLLSGKKLSLASTARDKLADCRKILCSQPACHLERSGGGKVGGAQSKDPVISVRCVSRQFLGVREPKANPSITC